MFIEGRSVHWREECSLEGGVSIEGRSVPLEGGVFHWREECSLKGGVFIGGRSVH